MALSKLDAINQCLAAIGSAPVSSEDDPNLDAAMASNTLDQVSEDIQSMGWWFNMEGNWKLTPDSNGEIFVPNNALSLTAWSTSRQCDLSIRGRKIYDAVSHSFNLTSLVNKDGKIEFLFIFELPFEDLPPVARYAVMYRARRLFAKDVEGDTNKFSQDTKYEESAFLNLDRTEKRNRKHNMLRDNPQTSSAVGLIGGRNAGIFRFTSGFPRSKSNG